jgi:phospholipid/cholesterol/gamma-HCH transport system permease protein
MFLIQLVYTGIDAIAMITLLAVLVGIGVTSQLIYIMQVTAGAGDIIAILARLVLSEMGPLITGFILVGRSCSAMVVDLGNTKVSGEIEPLEYAGIDVYDFFVLPRVLSMMISQVTLALYFTAVMIIFGVFFSSIFYDISAQKSLTELLGTITVNGVLRFVVKNIFFGLIVGVIACFHGLMVKNLPTQVPEQMQSAVIRSLVFLFLADGYFIVFTL